MSKEIISNIIFVAAIMMLCMMWYFAWVVPNTDRMYSIMDCMEEIRDMSEDGYNYCVGEMNERR
ncbi:MAG: hypothetical protein CME70_19100 [Halobacteriovorax sp.]|nr:hypothetical protein [Halobacteriovorax sp.]|tara:strand:+ start:454 stop:645 length:192 start_codon:yes stop_codon:yes gene_type:complete